MPSRRALAKNRLSATPYEQMTERNSQATARGCGTITVEVNMSARYIGTTTDARARFTRDEPTSREACAYFVDAKAHVHELPNAASGPNSVTVKERARLLS